MRNWRKRTPSGWHRRRPAGRRERIIVLGIIGLFALLAYFKGVTGCQPFWLGAPPAVVAGPATVIDGDSISIAGWPVRLQGIDAPEWEQTCTDASGKTWACGRAAARELATLVRGKHLTCKPRDFDQYKRVLAVCSLPDGTDVSGWLVQQGWAVVFGHSSAYAAAEAEAKAAKRGLWAGTFMRPSEWRERQAEQ